MRCLIDINIFLEVLLNQENSSQARPLLQKSDIPELFMSDFSLHSIVLILLRRKASELEMLFLADTAQSGSVDILRIMPGDLTQVIAVARRYALDFDDAYQYVLAVEHELTLVSFDSDFDRTPHGRQLPSAI
ncbi:MAG: PIN domain-containing protein [Syntrophobacteraceae bacterium]|nr:PIN domain-containing protein [Syntrophobacteraceae bacterium]